MKIQYLMEKSKERNEEWGMSDIGIGFRALELGGEVGELLNIIKKLERERLGFKGSTVSYIDVCDELADVAICLVNLANTMNINLEKSIKCKFNKDSKKHNFKTLLE